MRFTWRLYVVGVFVVYLLGGALSCTNPTDPQELKSGLRLYVKDALTHNIYAFDPITHELIDSLPGNYTVDIVCSKSGQFLFATNSAPVAITSLRKIRTQPLQLVDQLPMAGELVFLERKNVLLRAGSTNLFYIDPVGFAIEAIDTIRLRAVAAADTVGFILGTDTIGRLTAYDFRNKLVLAADSIFIPDGPPAHCRRLALHPSGKQGYGLVTDAYQRAWFIVFNTPGLELESLYELNYARGYVSSSPDGKLVLFHDPGDVPHGYYVGLFFVYDVQSSRMIKIVRTDTLSLAGSFPQAMSYIRYSPDGRLAFISCGGFGWSNGPILIFDLAKLAFVDCINGPRGLRHWLPGPIAVGPEP